jgi:arylsulfatase A-like enzyme
MYEESIRVPLIWNQPGRIQAGQNISAMVSSYDFFPTILDYLDVQSPPPDRQRIGRSYAAFLRGESPSWRDELYFEYCYTRAVRTAGMKYVERAENWPSELFDLDKDPGEEVNVSGWPAYRDRLQELRGKLRDVFQTAGAPPIEKWHDSVRNVLTLDTGYYDGWLNPPAK